MRHLIAVVLLLGPLAAGAAQPAAKAPQKERLVCTQEASVGSHIKRRTCMTESERKERRRQDQERAARMQNRDFKTNVEN